MKSRNLYMISAMIALLCSSLLIAADPPKREFRGAWIATVADIDWPQTRDINLQKARLKEMLDELEYAGINIVIFQIRPECDALYESELEPWSAWVTGKQGRAPDPYYDPLQFAIDETHARGMELHAWFNPYRAAVDIDDYSRAESHVTNAHPEWILSFSDGLRLINPGIPDVRQHVTDVIMDVVWRYDVDGIHFDDYFYPYPPNNMPTTTSAQDYDTYQTYKHGNSSDNNFGDWRRENVNILMRMIHDSIQVVKPHVKFGISPFGIYKNGVPSGIIGMDAYNVIFADPLAWLEDRSIDYITPQLYWEIGGNQDFKSLADWWANQVEPQEQHLYTGHIFGSGYSSNELPNQLAHARGNDDIFGNVYFSAKHFGNNTLGFNDKLVSNYYKYPALLPIMAWKDTIAPNTPQNFRYEPLAGNGPYLFKWDMPEEAEDGDTASRFVVYRFNDPPDEQDLQYSRYLMKVTGNNQLFPESGGDGSPPFYYLATALDRNYNESMMSNVVSVSKAEPPVLASPETGAGNQRDTLYLEWNWAENTSSFRVEVSDSLNMSQILLFEEGIQDTSKIITGLNGLTDYYWRVASENPAGVSEYSEVYEFRTGFPPFTHLASPEDGMSDLPLDTVLTWYETDSAMHYRVQLNQTETFVEDFMELDTTITGDTSLVVENLDYFSRRWYYWRVMASNQYGSSQWSDTWMFRTISATFIADNEYAPVSYQLEQNYPNPFNPTTTIEYSLAEPGMVSLKVYDLLGREVRELVNAEQTRGHHSIKFDGSDLAAGVYVYRLIAGNQVFNKKLILVK